MCPASVQCALASPGRGACQMPAPHRSRREKSGQCQVVWVCARSEWVADETAGIKAVAVDRQFMQGTSQFCSVLRG